jgi:DNA-binding CsgD family transcriptional regulator
MPRNKRIKTPHAGVYYIEGSSQSSGKRERIYYIRYRSDGKLREETAGRQFQDSMTPEKAATIRTERIAGKEKQITATSGSNQEITESSLLQEKWVLFMEASTESFILYDSEINVIEINQATLDLYPPGTRKTDIVGKHLLDILPELEIMGEYEKYVDVIKTGNPIYAEGVPPPLLFGDSHLNYKAFKVGDGLGMIIRDVTDSKRKEQELKKKQLELESKTSNLEEVNTALKVLLKRREADKTDLEKKVLANVKELIEPFMIKIKKSRLDESQRTYIDLIESNLNDIISPFVHAVSSNYLGLTHGEIEVANLIKHGKATKEIADLMYLSINTIQSYRKSIRKKLGINNKKVNLRTYLSSFT